MHKWRIIYYMKDGSIFSGRYETPIANSTEVATTLFDNPPESTYTASIFSDDKPDGVLFVRKEEVMSFVILLDK